MSEKRYVIVSASHHNKPRAMFLSEPLEGKTKPTWRNCIESSLLFTLEQAKKAADETPIGCYIIEHNENLRMWLSEKEGIKFATLIDIAIGEGCEVIGDLPQSMQPEAESESQENKRCYALYSRSADGLIKYFCDEKDAIMVAIHKGQRVQIFTQSEAHELQHLPYTDEANADVWNVENIGLWNLGEPQKTPKEKRECVLYRYLGEGSDVKQFYFSYNEKDCYSKNLDTATLYTEDEAMLQVNKLAHAGSKGWFCVHRDAFNANDSFKEAEQETPAPAPEAKKRVGYVLFQNIGGTKVYSLETKITAWVNSDNITDAVRADVYQTQEQADFAAYALNNYAQEFAVWQVEQIEF